MPRSGRGVLLPEQIPLTGEMPSTGEIKNMYYIAEDQKYVTSETALDRRTKCQCLLNATSSLMKYLKSDK
jgi:hypothetical protein